MPSNTAPTAEPDFVSVLHDQPLNNDYDADGDPITALQVTDATHGSATLNSDGSFWYQPDPGYVGSGSFSYQASDGSAYSNTVDVTITISDQAPVANPDTYEIHQGLPLNVPVDQGLLANDTDPDSVDTLTAVNFTQPANGTLNPNSDGSFSYTPAPGFVGTDSFTYRASDGAETSDPVQVTISVTDTDPTGTDDTYVVHEGDTLFVSAPGVLVNDFDQDGDYLSAVLVSQPAYGGFDFSADGSFDYTPEPGTEGTTVSFTYRAWDGAALSGLLTVNLQVQAAGGSVYTFTVTTTADIHDANPGDGIAGDYPGHTSLRSAIEEGNALPADSTIVINFDVGGATIVTADLPALDRVFSIDGPGVANQTISVGADSDDPSRLFYINPGRYVDINNLALTGGWMNTDGGAILNRGSLYLWNVDLHGNHASWTGGAVANYPGADLTIENANIHDNEAGQMGGAINDAGGQVWINNSWIAYNQAGQGGGISEEDATQLGKIRVDSTDLYWNTASGDGGGSYIRSGQFTMIGGSAYMNQAGGEGGGSYFAVGRASMTDVLIQSNHAAGRGGGVYTLAATFTLNTFRIGGNISDVQGGGNGGAWRQGYGELGRINPVEVGTDPVQDFEPDPGN